MSYLPTIPKLRPDLVTAAFPAIKCSGSWRSANNFQPELSDCYESIKAKDPLYYNSLVDKYTRKYVQKPTVKKHLYQMGFIAVDGTVYPTREEQIEANRINRLYEERQNKLRKLQLREQSHLRHLSKAALSGEVTFTKDGVFESKPSEECDIYHQVDSHLPVTINSKSPCWSSSLGKRQGKERKTKNNLRWNTQTSKRQLPDQLTQAPHRSLPTVGDQTFLVHKPTKNERESSFKSVSQCQSNDGWSEHSTGLPSSASFADSYSSYTEERDALRKKLVQVMVENKEVDEAIIAQALVLEEETLEEKLQEELKNNHETFNCETELQDEFNKHESIIQNELARCKSAYCTELYRNAALQAILNTLADEQQRVHAAVEKQKATEKLREEQRKMDELIEEQLRLKMKKKLEKESEENLKHKLQTATNMGADVKNKKEDEKALADKQDTLSYKQQDVNHSISSCPRSRLARTVHVQQVSESSPPAFTRIDSTKRDVTHMLSVLKQIKQDTSNLFPQIQRLLKERAHSYSSIPDMHVSSRKSAKEHPSANKDSKSSSIEEAYKASDQEDTFTSYSTLGCLSDSWSELDSSEEEWQQEDTESAHRVPKPPAYPRPKSAYPVRGMTSFHSSFGKIKEGTPSNCPKEFVSPLTAHSHAVVPYQSQRTRLRLRKNTELTPSEQKEYYAKRLRESRADLAEKEDEIRKSLLELIPPKRTLEEYYAAEAEGTSGLAPTPILSSTASKTQLETAEEKTTDTSSNVVAIQVLEDEDSVSTECATGIPRTDTPTCISKEELKSLCDEYSATCLQETSSTFMFSAGSATLAKINASIAKARAKARSASEPVIPTTVKPVTKKTDSDAKVDTLENKLSSIFQSCSKSSINSSKKESRICLDDVAPVVIEKITQNSRSASTQSSKNRSSSSLKKLSLPMIAAKSPTPQKNFAQSETEPEWEAVISRRSSCKSLNKFTLPTKSSKHTSDKVEKMSPASVKKSGQSSSAVSLSDSCADILKKGPNTRAPIVAGKRSTVSITPSEVSVESYMESFSPKGTKAKITMDEVPTIIKSPSGSKKSLSSLGSSLKSILLPSQLSAKLSKKLSQTGNDETTTKVSTSCIHSPSK